MSCFKTITISSFYPISPDFEIASFLTRASVPERSAVPKTRDRTGFFTNPAKMYVAADAMSPSLKTCPIKPEKPDAASRA